ncbi:MAG: hypothetical protein SFV22_11885 [Saprospiraceae bacterium]|nr:hypothetical protein [Saprospiraceae bacterium]
MKTSRPLSWLLFSLLLLAAGCSKEPEIIEAVLPETVELGKSETYVNGVRDEAYIADFRIDTFHKLLNFPYGKVRTGKYLEYLIMGFSWAPIQVGNFSLSGDQRTPGNYVDAGFTHLIAQDLLGYSYELIEQDNGFFSIESLDTVKMEVSGRFKVKFERTSKNGNPDFDLPRVMLFQGVFHEKYRIQ